MAGINKVILVGNLGKDPEIRYTASGMAVAHFSLATTERVKGEDRTEWHNIVAFDKLAEICGEYLAKGRQVYIEGRIQKRDYDDKDGNKRTSFEIIANTLQMLGQRGDSDGYRDSRPRESRQGQSGDQRSGDQRSGGGPRSSGPSRDQNRNAGVRDSGGQDGGWGGGYEGPGGDDDIPF